MTSVLRSEQGQTLSLLPLTLAASSTRVTGTMTIGEAAADASADAGAPAGAAAGAGATSGDDSAAMLLVRGDASVTGSLRVKGGLHVSGMLVSGNSMTDTRLMRDQMPLRPSSFTTAQAGANAASRSASTQSASAPVHDDSALDDLASKVRWCMTLWVSLLAWLCGACWGVGWVVLVAFR